MRSITVTTFRTLLMTFVAMSSAPLAAQPVWPQRSVKVITPLPVGTGVDLVARLYAERFSRMWQQPVIVENRVGADGIMATRTFVSDKDDHALLLSIGAPITIAPLTRDKLGYDPASDIVPIAQTAEQYLAIGVSNTLGLTTLKQLEERARKAPGDLAWSASTGLPELSFTSFVNGARLNMAKLTYRDTSTPLADLGEGRLHVFVSGMAAIRPQILAGKATFVALLGSNRYPASPEIPTVSEAGYPHMTVIGITALFGWKDMPADIIQKIAGDVKTIAEDKELQAKLSTAGLTPRYESAEALGRMLSEQKSAVAAMLGKAPN